MTDYSKKLAQNTGIIPCACGSIDHHILFTFNPEDKDVWVHYQLVRLPWHKRIWMGIKYIFGFQSIYGMYGELLINESNIDLFYQIIDHVKNGTECMPPEE